MKILTIVGLLIASQASCSSATPSRSGENGSGAVLAQAPSPSPAPEPEQQPEPEAKPDSDAPCPTHKFRFTKETGCRNDGTLEFCLPLGNDAVLARAREIAPTIEAGPVQGGRAGCEIATERWYGFPTGEAECVERHGALVDEAWDRLCRLAALPEVTRIVPTWYE